MVNAKLYFDGDCFFCRNFVMLSKLKSQIDVELIDLRQHQTLAGTFLKRGIDIDRSLVLEVDGIYFLKSSAMAFLLKEMGYLRVAFLFERKILGTVLYNTLVFLRRIYLLLTGRKPFRLEG